MRTRSTLRPLFIVALVVVLAGLPSGAVAAPASTHETLLVARVADWVRHLVGAEEGGPDIDPLGFAAEVNPDRATRDSDREARSDAGPTSERRK